MTGGPMLRPTSMSLLRLSKMFPSPVELLIREVGSNMFANLPVIVAKCNDLLREL